MALKITILKNGVEREVRHTLDQFKVKEYNNALSESSALESDFSIGLKIPVEGNELTFDMKHLAGVVDRSFGYDVRFYSSNGKVYNGTLYLENVVEEDNYLYYDTNYVNSTYNSLVDGKTLRDLDDTTFVVPLDDNDKVQAWVDVNALEWPNALYYLPMMHHSDLGKKGFNVWNQTNQTFEVNTGQEDLFHMVPQVYMLEVLKRCFTTFGYTVSGSVWNDAEMRNMLVGGLRSFTQIGVKYMAHYVMNNTLVVNNTTNAATQYPMVMDEAIYDFNTAPSTLPSGTPYDPQVIDNYRYSIILVFGDVVSPGLNIFTQSGAFVTTVTPVPNTTISFVITTVNSPTNMGLRLSATFGHVCHVMPGSKFKVYPQQNETMPEEYGFWIRELRLTECLPDLPITEFLLAVKRLGLRIDINNNARHVEVGWCDELLDKDAVLCAPAKSRKLATEGQRMMVLQYTNADFEDNGFPSVTVDKLEDAIIVVGEPSNYYVRQTNAWYQYNGGTDLILEPGEMVAVGNARYSYGNGDESVLDMGALLLPMTVVEVLPAERSLAPWIDQDLKHKKFNEPSTDSWELFWLLRRGMQPGEVSDYPMASTTRYNYNMDDLGNDLLLQENTVSVVHKRWKRWLAALSRNEVLSLLVMAQAGKHGGMPNELLRIDNLLYMTKTRTRELNGGEVMEVEVLRM